ncbi:MAG: DUF2628 domain-containing protein [Deltaproteobacteria bacterium]|nr:DUF2628 domain-containing protein [Deltaproteobacteria bacterium]
MKKFSILRHATSGYEVVKNGWSWPAFFFTWIWAFVKKLWLIGVIVFLFGIRVPVRDPCELDPGGLAAR